MPALSTASSAPVPPRLMAQLTAPVSRARFLSEAVEPALVAVGAARAALTRYEAAQHGGASASYAGEATVRLSVAHNALRTIADGPAPTGGPGRHTAMHEA